MTPRQGGGAAEKRALKLRQIMKLFLSSRPYMRQVGVAPYGPGGRAGCIHDNDIECSPRIPIPGHPHTEARRSDRSCTGFHATGPGAGQRCQSQ